MPSVQSKQSLEPEPPIKNPSAWKTFTNWVGRVWKTLTSLPGHLLNLIKKVKQIETTHLKQPSLSSPQKNSITEKKEPVQFHHHLLKKDSSSELPQKEESSKSGPFIDSRLSALIDDENPFHSDSKPDESALLKNQIEIDIPPTIKEDKPIQSIETHTKSNTIEKDDPLNTKKPVKVKKVTQEKVQSIKPPVKKDPKTIDVPDKGNCLFCALGVGLKLKHQNNTDIQNQLDWSIRPKELSNDLSKAEQLLQKPSNHLRQQAAAYLEKNKNEPAVVICLIGAITDHNQAVEKKIQEDQSAIRFLEEDIEILESRLVSYNPKTEKEAFELVEKQITEKKAHLANLCTSVEQLRRLIVSEDDFDRYIHLSKQDRVQCGIAQIYALGQLYKIPIEVIYDYGKPNQRCELYGADQFKTEPLTLAYINGNHFQLYLGNQ